MKNFIIIIASLMLIPVLATGLSMSKFGDINVTGSAYGINASMITGPPANCSADNAVIGWNTNLGTSYCASGLTDDQTLNEVGNPTGNSLFEMSEYGVTFEFTTPADPMKLYAKGAYSDAVLLLQQDTGNPGSAYMLKVNFSDTDLEGIGQYLPATTTDAMCLYVDGDAVERYELNADGKMEWGDGTNAKDTSLYRSAANVLKTDDAFHATGITNAGNYEGSNLDIHNIQNIGDTDDEIGNVYIADTVRTYYGNDQDSSIYHDGTYLVLVG